MNNRGQIAIILLAPTALVLAMIVLFSFVSFNNEITNEDGKIKTLITNFKLSQVYINEVLDDSVLRAIESADKNDFENSFREEFERIVNERDLRLAQGGNFFGRVRNGINGGYSLVKNENLGVYNLTINDVFIKSEVGDSEIVKEFDLSRTFDENGPK